LQGLWLAMFSFLIVRGLLLTLYWKNVTVR
jgi:Na+-driven multidrug efflux pump